MNKRLFKVRKHLALNQEDFGKRLGLSKPSISALESGSRNLTEPHIKLLVNEFNVNEDWLRTGEGEMLEEVSSDELDKLARKHNLNPLAKKIVETFITLEKNEMNSVLSFIDKISSTINSEVSVSKDESTYEVGSMSDEDKEVEAYRLEIRAEKKGKTLQVSENGEDIG